jgi:ABC-type antimicrobial peptide transport system permease subunit
MPLLLTSGSTMGFKIREVPLVGIFRYKNPGQFMSEIIITDPQTVRVLNSIQVAGGITEGISPGLLNAGDDDIFGEAFVFSAETDEPGFSADLLRIFLDESKSAAPGSESGGDWNFILLRLKNGISAPAFISSLNKKIEPYGLTAVNWRIASGTSAILALLVQALFNSGIFLVSVVGVVAVINILLISVFRRVREIGTLRAIGASDFYIRSLIYCENIFIAFTAGLAGVTAGSLFFRWLNSMNLRINNKLIAAVLDGPVVRIEFLPPLAVFSFFVAVLLGMAATVYPVEAAVRIEPVTAVQRG